MTPPALSIIGPSGVGKTYLLSLLLPELHAAGLRTAVLKHSSHPHPLHPEGSDTALLSLTGVALVGFSTPLGLQLSLPPPGDEVLLSTLTRLAPQVDLILVEGWKQGPLPKLEVWRPGFGPLNVSSQRGVLAVITDEPLPAHVRRFFPHAIGEISQFILEFVRSARHGP